MPLSRDQILSSDDLPFEDVEVPQWGGTVRLRPLTLAEALALGEGSKDVLAARMLVMAATDEDGKPLFTDADVAALSKKNSTAMRSLLTKALKMNGMDAGSVRDAEKN